MVQRRLFQILQNESLGHDGFNTCPFVYGCHPIGVSLIHFGLLIKKIIGFDVFVQERLCVEQFLFYIVSSVLGKISIFFIKKSKKPKKKI